MFARSARETFSFLYCSNSEVLAEIQSVITEDDLDVWYGKALRGQSAELIGDKVMKRLEDEIKVEFPSTTEFEDFFTERGYDLLSFVGIWGD